MVNGCPVNEDSPEPSEPVRAILDHTDQSGSIAITIDDADRSEPLSTIIDDDNHSSPLPTIIDELQGGEVNCGSSCGRSSSRWSTELTLFYLWRSSTMTTLGEDSICLWTERNEADFRNAMYHNAYKWRLVFLAGLNFAVFIVALVDPCLTFLAVLGCPIMCVALLAQIAAQRVRDRWKARQMGQWSLILCCISFGCTAVPMGHFAASGNAPSWNGAECTHERIASNMEGDTGMHPLLVINLLVGPACFFVGVMVTFMTVSTRGLLAVFFGYVVPSCAAYLVVALNLPTTDMSPIPAAVMAVVSMIICFVGGASIGCMYVVLQRRAAVKSAEVSLART